MATGTIRTRMERAERVVVEFVEKPDGVTLELTPDEAVLVAALVGSAKCSGVANKVYDVLNDLGYGAGTAYNWDNGVPHLNNLNIKSKITGKTITH